MTCLMPAAELSDSNPGAAPFQDRPVIEPKLESWTNTSTTVVTEADHFFGGNLPPVTEAFAAFVNEISPN